MEKNKVNYYLDIAETVLKASGCLRRNFGCVIVKDDRIISTGFNGRIRNDHRTCKDEGCIRNEKNLKSGERMELCKGLCAEQKSLLDISYFSAKDSDLFLVGIDVESRDYFPIDPCSRCLKMIKQMDIKNVYIRETKDKYRILKNLGKSENDQTKISC